MLDTLIKNVTAVTMDDEKNLFANAFIGIKDGKITYVGTELPQGTYDEIINRINQIEPIYLENILDIIIAFSKAVQK